VILMKHSTTLLVLLGTALFALMFASCSATSTVRYDRENEKKPNVETEQKSKEDFNIIPYRTTVDIKEKKSNEAESSDLNPWYGFEQKDTSMFQEKKIVGTANGFRVQVLATDKLEQADSLKTDLNFKVTNKNIYVIFDPPFYKVEVGDFTSMSEAKDLNFKLNQMGYTESRVIASTVNIFE
jgi:hypothetical protein